MSYESLNSRAAIACALAATLSGSAGAQRGAAPTNDLPNAYNSVEGAFKLPDGSLPHWSSDPGDTDPLGGKPAAYGFGWFLDPYQGHPRMWHYGDTVGFKSAIQRFPQDGLTVIVLCDRSDLDAPALALRVADVLLNRPK